MRFSWRYLIAVPRCLDGERHEAARTRAARLSVLKCSASHNRSAFLQHCGFFHHGVLRVGHEPRNHGNLEAPTLNCQSFTLAPPVSTKKYGKIYARILVQRKTNHGRFPTRPYR